MFDSLRIRILAIGILALFAAGPTMAQTPATPLSPPTSPASATDGYVISYVCGDATLDTSPPPTGNGSTYNLGVSFMSAQTGEALANVAVRLRRHGRILLDFTAAGPHCLFSVPDADYRIEGTYSGEMKFQIIQTGSLNNELRW